MENAGGNFDVGPPERNFLSKINNAFCCDASKATGPGEDLLLHLTEVF